MIELRNVTKEYSKGNSALNGVSVKIERGEFVFIVGDSGSGKSTLIRLIMKELNPTEGTIIVNGQNLNRMKHRNIAKYRRGLGVVFQDFRLLRDRNIYENIAFALRVTETPTKSDQEKKCLRRFRWSVLRKNINRFRRNYQAESSSELQSQGQS